ncbi:MAG: rhomboid family intramembrane serine protease [Bacteroidota bacterium]
MFQQLSPIDRLRFFFSRREALPLLILTNAAIWLVMILVRNFAFLFTSPESAFSGSYKSQISEWLSHAFAVSANTTILVERPWTLFTYMFLHFDFFHILFNMLWLWWFGAIFIQYLSQRQLLGTYFFGGLAGAFLYIAAFNFFPVFSIARESAVALGASASVLAIVVAIAFYVPDYTVRMLFLGQMKIKYIAIITIAIDLLMIDSGNSGGHIAHLGGAIWGFVYVKMLPGFDPTRIFVVFRRENLRFSGPVKKSKFKVHKGGRPVSDDDYNREKILRQQRIDSILDKISRSGYDSLTKEEKELLFSSSQKKK